MLVVTCTWSDTICINVISLTMNVLSQKCIEKKHIMNFISLNKSKCYRYRYRYAYVLFFLVWKNFIHIKKKLYKKDKAGKQNTTQKKKIYIYIYLRFEITVKLKCGTTYITFTHSA